MKPRHPVYVISKGRHRHPLTARFLSRDRVPFTLAIEPQEEWLYRASLRHLSGEYELAILPFSNLGRGSIPARNWVWEDSRARGAERHWILDDNIRNVRRLYRGKRVKCDSGPAFAAIEDFVDRYENVGIAGMNYVMFGFPGTPAYFENCHVYSCLLIRNDLQMRWRGRLNEDTDLCLQAITSGWATVLVNVFLVAKMPTMTMGGGNTGELYAGDGRLEMARSLQRAWPGIVEVKRRYGRPQHVINWKRFRDDPPLRLRPDVDLSSMRPNEYGLRLKVVGRVRNPALRELVAEWESAHGSTRVLEVDDGTR